MPTASPLVLPLLAGTGIALGLGVPLAKAASLAGVGALAFAFWPTLAAALVLAGLGARQQGRPPEPARLARFALVAGLFGHALPMTALWWLSARAGAGFAALSMTLPPVFTLLVALAVGAERPALRRFAAVAAGLAGALLLVAGRGGSFAPGLAEAAVALAIPASIGAANVYRALHLPPGTSGPWLAGATLLASAVLLGGTALAAGGAGLPQQPAALGWLALQAAALVVGYRLYFALQTVAPPVTFSFIGYVMMATGVAIGLFAFGERLAATTLPALALIAAALWLLQRSPAPGSAR